MDSNSIQDNMSCPVITGFYLCFLSDRVESLWQIKKKYVVLSLGCIHNIPTMPLMMLKWFAVLRLFLPSDTSAIKFFNSSRPATYPLNQYHLQLCHMVLMIFWDFLSDASASLGLWSRSHQWKTSARTNFLVHIATDRSVNL